jgi:hypothetical protein
VNVNKPVKIPTIVFNRFDLKKEPWPQSWKIMNIRIINPAAKTESNKVRK